MSAYRPAAGVMLLDARGMVWVGQRLDSNAVAWQMPQGGLDEGEDALEGAYRELEEETGISRDLVELVAKAGRELSYDLPEELVGKLWRGKWKGQRQRWFLMRFNGLDADVNLQTEHPEFAAWKWVEPAELPRLIVPFKQALYEEVLVEFAPWIGSPAAGVTT